MYIGGISNYSYFSNAQYSVSRSSNENQEFSTEQAQGQKKPPKGGGPGGPKGNGGPPKGPDLDTDKDDSWSLSELEEYASFSASRLGIELDTDEIMSTYDTDEDGKISSEERSALGKDNAFKLPQPMESMQGIPPSNASFNLNNTNTSETTGNNTNAYLVNQLIAAYNQTSNLNLSTITSTVSFEV